MSDRPDVMSRVTNHFREAMGNCRVIEVPEWGDGEEPLQLYVWPATLLELQRINRKGGASGGDLALLVETLIVRAKDADRKPIFQPGHRARLMRECDPDVIYRLCAEINDDLAGEEQGATEGN